MAIELPLSEMTVAEKIHLMETLWDDLTRKPAHYESPDWHQEVLDECRRRAESGEGKFTDWEIAKKQIRERLA